MTARLALARRCGLGTDALNALRDESPVLRARLLLRARADEERLRENVEELLFGLVGGCTDTTRRRDLLAVRRCVHKGVPPTKGRDLVDELTRTHPEFGSWARAVRTAADLGADDAPEPGLRGSAAAVVAELSAPAILRGLAFASPIFARELSGCRNPSPDPQGRTTRTAVGYLVRAALKPSPFSTLTTLHSLGPMDPGGPGDAGDPVDPSGAPWSYDHTTFRPLAVELHRSCLRRPFAWTGPEPVRAGAAPTMRLAGLPYAFLPHYAHTRSMYYRTDELTELAGEAPPITPAEGVATGRLFAQRPWRLTDGHELTALFEDSCRRAWPDHVRQALGGAARAERAVREAARPETLTQALSDLRTEAEHALDAVGSRAGRWLLNEPLVHEAVAGGRVPSPACDLSRLAPVLARRVVPIAFYGTLRELFRALHGSGTAPLIDFCAEATLAVEKAAVPAADRQSVRDLPHGHLSLAAPASVAFVQADGDLVVVNSVMADYLGSRLRWGRLEPLHDALVEDAHRTASIRHPGTVAYQFSASTDWTTLQRPGPGLPIAEWGPALGDHPGARDLARFRLRLDPDTDTFQLTDPDGAPAALLYSGAIPPHLLKGVEGILNVLSSPWGIVPPRAPSTASPGGTTTPRLQDGNVVWGRRTWTLDPEVVPLWRRGDRLTEFLARVETMRETYGMPAEMFVAAGTAGSARPTEKPTWFSLDHPLTVLHALRDSDATRWVFTEALPAAESSERVAEYLAVIDHG